MVLTCGASGMMTPGGGLCHLSRGNFPLESGAPRDRQVAAGGRGGQASGVLATIGELLERVGVGADGVVAEELPHNRWLSPGVWRVRTSAGHLGVLKYTSSEPAVAARRGGALDSRGS